MSHITLINFKLLFSLRKTHQTKPTSSLDSLKTKPLKLKINSYSLSENGDRQIQISLSSKHSRSPSPCKLSLVQANSSPTLNPSQHAHCLAGEEGVVVFAQPSGNSLLRCPQRQRDT